MVRCTCIAIMAKIIKEKIKDEIVTNIELKKLLHEKNITQAVLAKVIGRDIVTVNRYCQGVRNVPLEDAINIAEYFKIRPEILLFGRQEKAVDYTLADDYILHKNTNPNLTVIVDRNYIGPEYKLCLMQDVGYHHNGCVYVIKTNGVNHQQVPIQNGNFTSNVLSKLTFKDKKGKIFQCLGVPFILSGKQIEIRLPTKIDLTFEATKDFDRSHLVSAYPVIARYNPLYI